MRPLLVALPALALAAPAATQEETSQFGEPLVVNGVRIPDLEIKRFLLYGPGRNAMEARKLELLMQQEKELREYTIRERLAEELHQSAFDDLTDEQKAAIDATVAEELSYLHVPMEKLEARLAAERADWESRYPTLDADTETRRAYKSVEWYESQVYQTMRFDAMFYPGHPDDWPEISIEAIHAGSPQFDLVADYAKHYEMRAEKAAEQGLDEVPPEEEMMMSILRDYVINALNSLVETKTSVDGLDPELLLTVEGMGFYAEVRTEDVWEEFKHVFTWRDIDEAKRFLALNLAAKQGLENMGALKDRDEFLEQVAEMREQMSTNMFNWQFLALMGHRFPSEEAYVEHMYLLYSFLPLIEDKTARDENNNLSVELKEYLPFANMVMGLGRCHTEVLFVSGFDLPRNEWRPDGFDGAYARAIALRGEIDAYIDRLVETDEAKQRALAAGENFPWPEDIVSFDEYWSGMLDLHSEWWDPPNPLHGKQPPDLGRKNKGRFNGEPMTRNDYKRMLGESSYYYYLFNRSTTDEIFMELDEGAVGGPYIGPYGYYIVYLRNRLAPSNPLDMYNERHFNMVVDDFSRNAFTDFAHNELLTSETAGVPNCLGD